MTLTEAIIEWYILLILSASISMKISVTLYPSILLINSIIPHFKFWRFFTMYYRFQWWKWKRVVDEGSIYHHRYSIPKTCTRFVTYLFKFPELLIMPEIYSKQSTIQNLNSQDTTNTKNLFQTHSISIRNLRFQQAVSSTAILFQTPSILRGFLKAL